MTTGSVSMNLCRCLLITISATAVGAMGADWPQFMGPNGNGASPEKGLLRAWPPNGPKVLWTASLGKGYGGAAVRDGKVYVLDRVGQQQDVLRCMDLATGKEEWKFSYEAPGSYSNDGSRSTPAVSEKHVYAIGPFGHFHCLDRITHQVVWSKNLLKDYGTNLPKWAVAQSPLLYKDLVIVAPQASAVGIVAFDQMTGNERWRSAPIGAMAYASPQIVAIAGMDQVVIVNRDGVAGVSAADGKALWNYPYSCKIPIPNVTDLGNGKLFVTGGYNAGSAIIQIAKQSEKWTVQEMARMNEIGGHCHPGLLYQDHIYVLCNTNDRADGMVCFDVNGKLVWQTKRDPYLCKGGSVLTADGIMYVMDGRSGELYIVEPSPAGFKSLGKVGLLGGKAIWGPLALADGKLLIRDQHQMKCVDLRGP